VQTKELTIGHPKPIALDRWENFGQRGRICSGEDILPEPGACRAGWTHMANGVKDHHAVIGHELIDFSEELVVALHADVLEHSDRHDAVELLVQDAIVLQFEPHAA